MKTISGDLIALAKFGHFDVIVHGCNCFCTMGAGIAKAIRAEFPDAYEADKQTTKGDREKRGDYSAATVTANGSQLTIVNAYTQYDYRGRGTKVDYDAVAACFAAISKDFGNASASPKSALDSPAAIGIASVKSSTTNARTSTSRSSNFCPPRRREAFFTQNSPVPALAGVTHANCMGREASRCRHCVVQLQQRSSMSTEPGVWHPIAPRPASMNSTLANPPPPQLPLDVFLSRG